MVKTFERVIKQTFDAIQYDGTNIGEILEYINYNHGNANDTSLEELTAEPYGKRPSEIPLDIDGSLYCKEKMEAWKAKYAKELAAYKASYSSNEEDFFTREAIEERCSIRKLDNDWQKGEEYHFYVSTGNGYCRMIGIRKNDWIYTKRGLIEIECDDGFKYTLGDGGYREVKNV